MPLNSSVLRLKRFWLALLILLILGGLLLAYFAPTRLARLLRRDIIWQTMQANGVWRVGMDTSFPPFEWLDDTGKPVGYDVELAERIARTWGMQLEIVPIGFDSLIDAVQTGRIDSVVSALPFDERLTQNIAYSPAYFDAGLALAVRPDSPIQTVANLSGHVVAVEWGSMGDMVGRRLQREDPSIQLLPFETPAEAVAALLDDQSVDALLVDHVTLRVAQVNGSELKRVGPILESNPYVIAMPVAAHELQNAVAETLANLQSTGVLTELEAKWFLRVE
jgi:ABC-type amino acid transport substrate-binding protein